MPPNTDKKVGGFMHKDEQVSARALEIATMMLGTNRTIFTNLENGHLRHVETNDIKHYLELARLLDPHIRKEQQDQSAH